MAREQRSDPWGPGVPPRPKSTVTPPVAIQPPARRRATTRSATTAHAHRIPQGQPLAPVAPPNESVGPNSPWPKATALIIGTVVIVLISRC
jgi:hypothetical protein